MKKLVLGMLAMTALVGCSSNNDPVDEVGNGIDPVAITFGQNIEIYSKAPVTGTTLANDTKIGLWACEYTEATYTWKAENKCDNSELTVAADGIKFNAGKEAYYSKIENTKYDFYAYTPFADAANNGITVNAASAGTAPSIGITLKADPASQTDLMYAAPLTGKTANTEAYELKFNHALAQVKFTVKKDAGVDLNTLTAISVATKSTSTMNLVDGSFATSETSIAMTPLTSGNVSLNTSPTNAGDAIMVFPEANVVGEVTFTIDTKEYKFTPKDVTLTKGKITTINVTITATGINFSQSVNEWQNETTSGTGTI